MRGGIPLDYDPDIPPESRAAVRAALDTLPEGTILVPEALFADRPDLAAIAHRLRGVDLIHLFEGHYTPIVETQDLRRPPARPAVVAAYEAFTGETVRPAGGQAAWLSGLTLFESADGFAYLTDGPDRTLGFLPEPLHLIHAPGWLLPRGRAGDILRALDACDPRRIPAYAAHLTAQGGLDSADAAALVAMGEVMHGRTEERAQELATRIDAFHAALDAATRPASGAVAA